MSRKKKLDRISAIFANKKKLTEILRKGVQEALLKHKLLKKPVVVWQKGRVVLIPPEKIVLKNSKKRKS